jgi:hypothetical protein
MSTVAAIHIVDEIANLKRLKDSSVVHEWECGRCSIAPEVAEKLVGADLYMHEGMSKPSRFGGKITGFRVDGGTSDPAGEVIFRFQASNDHRDVKTSRAGWANSTKIVW